MFGLHSLRAEEATAAANFEVSNYLFQNHGPWKSKNEQKIDISRKHTCSSVSNYKIRTLSSNFEPPLSFSTNDATT